MILMSPTVDTEGRVTISAKGNTFKVNNIKHNANVSMLVMGEEFYKPSHNQLDGKAEVVAMPEFNELLMKAYRRRLGGDLNQA